MKDSITNLNKSEPAIYQMRICLRFLFKVPSWSGFFCSVDAQIGNGQDYFIFSLIDFMLNQTEKFDKNFRMDKREEVLK